MTYKVKIYKDIKVGNTYDHYYDYGQAKFIVLHQARVEIEYGIKYKETVRSKAKYHALGTFTIEAGATLPTTFPVTFGRSDYDVKEYFEYFKIKSLDKNTDILLQYVIRR